jgi:hypothetical protein
VLPAAYLLKVDIVIRSCGTLALLLLLVIRPLFLLRTFKRRAIQSTSTDVNRDIQDLIAVINDKEALPLFSIFVKSRLCAESLIMYQYAERFRRVALREANSNSEITVNSKAKVMAQKIYRLFLANGSAMEVNVPHSVFDEYREPSGRFGWLERDRIKHTESCVSVRSNSEHTRQRVVNYIRANYTFTGGACWWFMRSVFNPRRSSTHSGSMRAIIPQTDENRDSVNSQQRRVSSSSASDPIDPDMFKPVVDHVLQLLWVNCFSDFISSNPQNRAAWERVSIARREDLLLQNVSTGTFGT